MAKWWAILSLLMVFVGLTEAAGPVGGPFKTSPTKAVLADSSQDGIPLQTTRFAVNGMHCGECVKKITYHLSQLKGVKGVSVSLSQNMTLVTHEASISLSSITDRLKKLGYEAKPVSPNQLRLVRYKISM